MENKNFKINKVLELPDKSVIGDWYLLKKGDAFELYIGGIDNTFIKNDAALSEEQLDKINNLPTPDEIFEMISGKVDKVDDFKEIPSKNGVFTISHRDSPFSKIYLNDEDIYTYDLLITNISDGESGKILVHQSGGKKLKPNNDITGIVELPISIGTIVLCEYRQIDGVKYITSEIIIGDYNEAAISRIEDLDYTFYDNSSVSLRWTAPYANTLDEPVSYYDIRYSNSVLDVTSAQVWGSLKKIQNDLVPTSPRLEEQFTVTGLKPNTEYVFYIKSVKVVEGVYSFSRVSNYIKFSTSGTATIGSKPYNIPINADSIYPQQFDYTRTGNEVNDIKNLVDEKDKNKFLSSGYPDTDNKNYSTYWMTYKYSRNTAPFNIDIDLYQTYKMDKIFLYNSSKLRLSVFASADFGTPWVKVGEFNTLFNSWGNVDFGGMEARFIRLSYDIIDFGVMHKPAPAIGTEIFPDVQYGENIEPVHNMIVYGIPLTKPDGIHEPMRRTTTKKTVDEFFCVNGHAYQPGRIHALSGGSKMRMYIHSGQFAQWTKGTNGQKDELIRVEKIKDLRFRISDIPWVRDNSGTGQGLTYLLQDTYKRYGVKPFLTSTGVFDITQWRGQGANLKNPHNRQVDDYWLPGKWRPMPKRGFDGLERFYSVTKNPQNYKTYARLSEALSAKYGNDSTIDGSKYFMDYEDMSTGLDLISGLEMENEPDANWNNWIGYSSSEEQAALTSALADGHSGTMFDEDGIAIKGTKISDIMAISSGTASANRGYYFSILHWYRSHRKDGNIPVRNINVHRYFSNVGNQGSASDTNIKYGITFEDSTLKDDSTSLKKLIDMRDRIAPNTEVWMTEFGWGEAGGDNTNSNYQCYTQPGTIVNGWLIPDRHRSEVRAAWIVRATLQMMAFGFDMVNYYSTETEANYFDISQWGLGPGYEMWEWYKLTDTTPGAKARQIKPFQHGQARGGFSAMGLFGNMLENGCYPITNTYWWTATMRKTLKGFVYLGKKSILGNEKIQVLVFYNAEKNKSAYAIYYNDSRNTGVTNVTIPLPSAATTITNVSVYLPQIPDPRTVPNNLAKDLLRTGMPTSRRERFEDGKWVTINRPVNGWQYASVTKEPSVYPANPVEGQEIATLPSRAENPYFPLVGPVDGSASSNGLALTANAYEIPPGTSGNLVWERSFSSGLAWRQTDAVCDFIEYSAEGKKGTTGIHTILNKSNGGMTINISEFPEFYVFDGLADVDFISEVKDLSAVSINSNTVELWWNNTSVEDEGYEIFSSSLPDANYTLIGKMDIGTENKYTVRNLEANTTYYFKVRSFKKEKFGEMSEQAAVKTLARLPEPTDLRLDKRTTTTIKIKWDYEEEQSTDFVHFALFRASATSSYQQIAIIPDKEIDSYLDVGLTVNTQYKYRIRAVGTNGLSEYSNVLETRTLLPEEMPPMVKTLATDKLGTKVLLKFDTEIVLLNNDRSFILEVAEAGTNTRKQINYTSIEKIDIDPLSLILRIPPNQLPTYTTQDKIYLSFNGENVISKVGSVKLEHFTNSVVSNRTNDFTGLTNVYNLNLTNAANLAEDPQWTNLVFPANITENVVFEKVKNNAGDETLMRFDALHNGTTLRWSPIVTGGATSISEDVIPLPVSRTYLRTAFGAKDDGAILARFSLYNLDVEKIYNIHAYSGMTDNDPTLKRPIRMEIGNKKTPTVQGSLNRTEFMSIDEVVAIGGRIDITFRSMYPVNSANNTVYPGVNWITIEELENPETAVNREVLIRDFTVEKTNYNDVIYDRDNILYINAIGAFTHYRYSINGNIEDSEWIEASLSSSKVPIQFPEGLTEADITVQVKNNYDKTVPMTKHYKINDVIGLEQIKVNIDNPTIHTTVRDIKCGIPFTGKATKYAIQEHSDFSEARWLDIADVIEFRLSADLGYKTIYVKVKDNNGDESNISDAAIHLMSDLNQRHIINAGDVLRKPGVVIHAPIKYGDTDIESGHYSNVIDTKEVNTNGRYGSYPLVNMFGETHSNLLFHYNSKDYRIDRGHSFYTSKSNITTDFRYSPLVGEDSLEDSLYVSEKSFEKMIYPHCYMLSSRTNKYQNVTGVNKGDMAKLAFNLAPGKYRLRLLVNGGGNIPSGQVMGSTFFRVIYSKDYVLKPLVETVFADISRPWFDGINFSHNLDFTLDSYEDIMFTIQTPTNSDTGGFFNCFELISNFDEATLKNLELDQVAINNDAEYIFNNNVQVELFVSGDTPTHMRYAESHYDLLSAEWVPYSKKFNYTFDPEFNDKSLYVQVKNDYNHSRFNNVKVEYRDPNFYIMDTVELNLELNEDLEKPIDIVYPKLKYNKKMALSYINEGTFGIFQNVFSSINHRWVSTATSGTFHLNMPRSPGFTEGFMPPEPLCSTDGTGNHRRFATTLGTRADRTFNGKIGDDVTSFFQYTSEKEFKFFRDFGFRASQQGAVVRSTGNNPDAQDCLFDLNLNYDNFKLYLDEYPISYVTEVAPLDSHTDSSKLFKTKVMTTLPGDERYSRVKYPLAPNFNINTNTEGGSSRRFRSTGATLRDRIIADLAVNANLPDNQIPWMLYSNTTRGGTWEYEIFRQIHEIYGRRGSDKILVASIDEIYEYWKLTRNIYHEVTRIDDRNFRIKLYIPRVDNFTFNDVSMLLGIDNSKIKSLTSNTQGLSHGHSSVDTTLINFNYGTNLTTRADKFVTAFENNPNDIVALEDAQYMVTFLKPELQTPFKNRIEALLIPTELTSLSLNGGVESTTSKVINVKFNTTGSTPISYRLAESESALSTAEWKPYSTDINYTFTTIGLKTLYGQVASTVNQSEVKNSSITITESATSVLIAFNATSYQKIDVMRSNGMYYNQTRTLTYPTTKLALYDKDSGLVRNDMLLNIDTPSYQETAHFEGLGKPNVNAGAFYKALVSSGVHDVSMIALGAAPDSATAITNPKRKARISLTLPTGKFRIRALTNTGVAAISNEAGRLSAHFGVYQEDTELTSVLISNTVGWVSKDNQTFNVHVTVDIDGTKKVDLGWWSTTTATAPHINLIEITKL